MVLALHKHVTSLRWPEEYYALPNRIEHQRAHPTHQIQEKSFTERAEPEPAMSSNSITLTAPSPRTVVSAIAVYAVLREVYHVYQSTLRAISTEKFCGGNDVQLSRGPVGSVWGKTSTVLLMVNKAAGTPITRATLMTLLSLTNARQVYSYSSAAGHHSSYISYCGVWDITWPLGQKCTVNLAPHDVHTQAADVYPDTFPARVDRCIEMLSGIVSFSESKVAFPGRAKSAGRWILEEVRGFPGAGELYNKMGGKVFLLDSLALKPVFGDLPGESSAYVELSIPCLGQIEKQAKLFVRPSELKTLAKSLDYLPWGRLSWSVHRGMKDLLVACGKKGPPDPPGPPDKIIWPKSYPVPTPVR